MYEVGTILYHIHDPKGYFWQIKTISQYTITVKIFRMPSRANGAKSLSENASLELSKEEITGENSDWRIDYKLTVEEHLKNNPPPLRRFDNIDV